jgi:hypothetical protein
MNIAIDVLTRETINPFALAERTRKLRMAETWVDRSFRLLPEDGRADLMRSAITAALRDNTSFGKLRFVLAGFVGRKRDELRHRAALRRLIRLVVDETRALDAAFRDVYDRAHAHQLERSGADASTIARLTA